MKKNFLLVFCFAFTFSAIAQEGRDSHAKKEKKLNVEFFISGGVSLAQYYSNKFSDYISAKTFFPTNGAPNAVTQTDYPLSSSIITNNFNSTKQTLSSILGLELQLNSKRLKKINHIVDVTYVQLKNEFSTTSKYDEQWNTPSGPGGGWSAEIKDTIQSKYGQSVISLGYKFQPTYKFIFFQWG